MPFVHVALMLLYGVIQQMPEAEASAWLMPKHQHQLFITIRHHVSDVYHNTSFEKEPECRQHMSEGEAYWEYGLRRDVTIGMKHIAQRVAQDRVRKNRGACDSLNSVGDRESALAWKEQRYFARVPLYRGRSGRILSLQAEVYGPGIYTEADRRFFGERRFGFGLRIAYGRKMRTMIVRKPFSWLPEIKGISVMRWHRFLNREYGIEHEPEEDRYRISIEETYGFTQDPWFFWTTFEAKMSLGKRTIGISPVEGDYDYSGYRFRAGRYLDKGSALIAGYRGDFFARNYRGGNGVELSFMRTF